MLEVFAQPFLHPTSHPTAEGIPRISRSGPYFRASLYTTWFTSISNNDKQSFPLEVSIHYNLKGRQAVLVSHTNRQAWAPLYRQAFILWTPLHLDDLYNAIVIKPLSFLFFFLLP